MKCAVENCFQNNCKKSAGGKTVSFFRFPKDTEYRKLWEIFCNREDTVNAQYERICSLHFREVDFERNLKFEMGFSTSRGLKLKPGAVPTINNNLKNEIENPDNMKTLTMAEKYSKIVTSIAEDFIKIEDSDSNMDTIGICEVIENGNDEFLREQSNAAEAIVNLGETIRNTLLEIEERREQNRERRHQELLNVLLQLRDHERVEVEDISEAFKGKCIPTELENVDHQSIDNVVTLSKIPDDIKNEEENGVRSSNKNSLTKPNFFCVAAAPKLNQEVFVTKEKNKDLKIMRAKMLELQRKKMNDRVGKKRNGIQVKKF